MQTGALIEFVILRGVNEIEARDPTNDAECENDRRKIDMSGLRDPGADRGNGEREPEKKVCCRGEAFGDGVEEDNRQCERRKRKRQAINIRRADNEAGATDEQRRNRETSRDEQMPRSRARIALVDLPID